MSTYWLRCAALAGALLCGATGTAEAIQVTSQAPCFDVVPLPPVGVVCPAPRRPLVVGQLIDRLPVTVLNDEGTPVTLIAPPGIEAPFTLCAAAAGPCMAPDFATPIPVAGALTFFVNYDVSEAGAHSQAIDLNTTGGSFQSITAQGSVHLLDIIMLFDNSGSMQWLPNGTDPGNPPLDPNARLRHAKAAGKQFALLLAGVPGIATGARMGVCVFNYAGVDGAAAAACDPVTAPSGNITQFVFGNVDTAIDNVSILWAGTQMGRGLQAALNRVTEGDGTCPVNHKCVILMLSNGAHNSGPVPEDALPGTHVSLYAVGYGNTGDVNPERLSNLVAAAENTPDKGFRHFDPVACPADVPAGQCLNTSKQLDGFFASTIHSLGLLQPAVDPQSTIAPGQTQAFDVNVVELDRTAQFLMSWQTPPQTVLRFDLLDPQGVVVDPAVAQKDEAVEFVVGSTYMLYRIRDAYLRRPNKVGVWKVRVAYGSVGPRLAAVVASQQPRPFTYSYGAYMASSLELQVGFNSTSYRTGDPMTITASVTARGVRLQDKAITSIKLLLERPEQGIGTWHAEHAADPQLTGSIPPLRSGEPLTGVQRKGLAVRLTGGVAPPGRAPVPELLFTDDGQNGDAQAGDGVYTTRFTDTVRPDTYSFQIVATGTTPAGLTFTREALVQQHIAVNVVPDPATSPLTFQVVNVGGRTRHVRVQVVLKDPFANFFGPGHPDRLDFQTTAGTWLGPVEDDLLGGYSRVLVISGGQDPDVTVSVDGKSFPTTNVNGALRPRVELGLFAGRFFLDNSLPIDDGPVFGVRVGVPLSANLTAEGEMGVTPTNDTSGARGRVIQALASLRWDLSGLTFGTMTPFVTGGVGVLDFTGFSTTDSGAVVQFGGGLRARVSSRTGLRLEARELFGIDTFSRNTDNFQLTFGVDIGF